MGVQRQTVPQVRSAARALPWLAIAALVAWLVGYAVYRPLDNADLVFYVATAHSWDGLSGSELQRVTYDDVRAFVPPSIYDGLVGATGDPASIGHDYLATVARDPVALTQQLPFYSVKVLYPGLMLALSKVGIPLPLGSVVISAVAYGLLALLLFLWLRRHLAPGRAWLLCALLALSPPFWVLASESTPDALALAIELLGIFVLLELRRPGLGFAILAAAILARPNAVILLLAVAAALLVAPDMLGVRVRARTPLAAAVAGVAIAAGLTAWSHNYGLGVLFYHAVVAYLPYPVDGAPALAATEVLRLYLFRIARLPESPIPLFVLLGALAIFLGRPLQAALRRDAYAMLVLAMFLAMALGWLTYPNEPERILAPPFLVCAVALLVRIGEHPPGRGSSATGPMPGAARVGA